MNIVSRKDAIEQGLPHYFTGKPCRNGHTDERFTRSSNCLECERQRYRSWYDKNKEAGCESAKAWQRENKVYLRSYESQRRHDKNNATPAWADKDEILRIYEEADRLTKQTGTMYHVDHIVPLKSTLVCGLHVPANLRPLPALDNIRKGNKWWPGHPYEVTK